VELVDLEPQRRERRGHRAPQQLRLRAPAPPPAAPASAARKWKKIDSGQDTYLRSEYTAAMDPSPFRYSGASANLGSAAAAARIPLCRPWTPDRRGAARHHFPGADGVLPGAHRGGSAGQHGAVAFSRSCVLSSDATAADCLCPRFHQLLAAATDDAASASSNATYASSSSCCPSWSSEPCWLSRARVEGDWGPCTPSSNFQQLAASGRCLQACFLLPAH
jgi:hypothetical protein